MSTRAIEKFPSGSTHDQVSAPECSSRISNLMIRVSLYGSRVDRQSDLREPWAACRDLDVSISPTGLRPLETVPSEH